MQAWTAIRIHRQKKQIELQACLSILLTAWQSVGAAMANASKAEPCSSPHWHKKFQIQRKGKPRQNPCLHQQAADCMALSGAAMKKEVQPAHWNAPHWHKNYRKANRGKIRACISNLPTAWHDLELRWEKKFNQPSGIRHIDIQNSRLENPFQSQLVLAPNPSLANNWIWKDNNS
jgi:hypothetical protein